MGVDESETAMMTADRQRAVGHRRLLTADLTTLALLLVSAPLYALGYVAGVLWRCVLWVAAAVVAGFKAGRG